MTNETNYMFPRKRKSVALTTDEFKALKVYRKQFRTEVECAISIGIDRTVLNRILLVGSGSPDTIKRIRKVLQLGDAR